MSQTIEEALIAYMERVKELEEALKPFTQIEGIEKWRDPTRVYCETPAGPLDGYFTVGDLKRAKKVAKKK